VKVGAELTGSRHADRDLASSVARLLDLREPT
jgi:hypothetical protein